MRFREPFCLYKRKISKKRVVWYYKTYDENGNRTCGHSTGLTSKTKARYYCMDLYSRGKLVPSKKQKTEDMTFEEYSKDWWVWDKCAYIKARKARGLKISRAHVDNQFRNMEKHILPTFGKIILKNINSSMIENWLLGFTGKGLSNGTANHNLKTLRIMLNEAERLGKIEKNPVKSIQPLAKVSQERGILTQKEVQKLFNPKKAEDFWKSPLSRLMNQLAACTAMRLGEVVALQCEDVKEDYIIVHRSYDRKYGLKSTKTNDKRILPVPTTIFKELKKLREQNKKGFLFSLTDGKEPFYYRTVTDHLYYALEKIEVKDRKDRNISFHSWRHYFNSLMRANNISDSKVQQITGHQTDGMTEHYTHYQPEDFKEVRDLQENVFNFPQIA